MNDAPVVLIIKKLRPTATLPQYKSEGAAGFDFAADFENGQSETIAPKCQKIIPTGLACELEPGFELQIRPRSGLAAKNMVTVTNSPGTVDSDYRGEIKVILINHGNTDFVINQGDRIAQGVVNKIPSVVVVESKELSDTERGSGGFGSTGVGK